MRNEEMQNGHPSNSLVRFIEHLQETSASGERATTVLDLRLACRLQRLTEEGDWSLSELEQIEQEAIHYGDETELTSVLSGEASPAPVKEDVWLNSPSPFAWT